MTQLIFTGRKTSGEYFHLGRKHSWIGKRIWNSPLMSMELCTLKLSAIESLTNSNLIRSTCRGLKSAHLGKTTITHCAFPHSTQLSSDVSWGSNLLWRPVKAQRQIDDCRRANWRNVGNRLSEKSEEHFASFALSVSRALVSTGVNDLRVKC